MSILRYSVVCFVFLIFCNLKAQENTSQSINELLKVYDSNDEPGLSVKVIIGDESIYSKGLGLSNLDYDIKNSDSTVHNIASITKQFTASAIWSLINENKIGLEDDIRTYLPEFPAYKEAVKIKHLLNHTSGIRNYHTLMYLSGFDYDNNYYDNNTVLELAIRQKNLNHPPNEKVSYSNTNYNLLTLIVERVSGLNLNDYLKLKILEPLKMYSTFVRVEHGRPIKNRAIGYVTVDNGFKFSVNNQLSYGAGSMGSSVNDLGIWAQMLNEQIAEFKPLAQFLKQTETLNSGEKANYARGLMVDTYKGFEVVGHSGYGFGSRSHLIAVKEKQLGVMVLTNTQTVDATRIAYQILDILLKEEKMNEVKAVQPLFEKQDINQFTGEFKEVNSDMIMKLFVENDTLRALGQMSKIPVALVPYAKNKFHRLQSQNVKYDFTPSASHDMIISFGGTPFYFERAKFIDATSVKVKAFTGDFYSEELGVTYHFSSEGNTLKLMYKENKEITLKPIQLNQFGNGDRTLFHFVKDKNDKVTGMLLSCDGTVKEIIFKKKRIAI
jgi:CubicO group peptidase (beta-lactamase class C family)